MRHFNFFYHSSFFAPYNNIRPTNTGSGGLIHIHTLSRRKITWFMTQWDTYEVFSCDQEALRTLRSVRLSVYPSVCHTFFTILPSSYHHEIFRVITNDRSDVHAKGQGQRPNVKVTEVKTLFSRFRTVPPVWMHTCRWNNAQSTPHPTTHPV